MSIGESVEDTQKVVVVGEPCYLLLNPAPGSKVFSCVRCAHLCYVATPSNVQRIEEGAIVLCRLCMLKELGVDERIEIPQDLPAHLSQVTGQRYTLKQVQESVDKMLKERDWYDG